MSRAVLGSCLAACTAALIGFESLPVMTIARADGQQAQPDAAAGFAAPAPSHLALFKLYMATYADVLASDDVAAWEHHLLTRVPASPDERSLSPECFALSKQVQNEITADSLRTQAKTDFEAALKQAAGQPRTGTFVVRTWERFGSYDAQRGMFPLEAVGSRLTPRGAFLEVPRAPFGILSPEEERRHASAAGVGPAYCTVRNGGRNDGGIRFRLDVQGNEMLTGFAMDRGAAEAYLNDHPDRIVALEAVLAVGPVSMGGTGIGATHRAPARITAARIRDWKDGRVLQTFAGVAATAKATAAGPAPGAAGAVAFTSNRALLLTLRDHPHLGTDEALTTHTANLVGTEQMAWKTLDRLMQMMGEGRRWNPKKRTFLYEWQSLVEHDPALASGPLLDTFLRTDPDWSFVKRDPAWDDRFDAVVAVFLFARDKVEGREPSFAAQELLPVYKRHLSMAVAKVPTSFWITIPTAGFRYDFPSRSLVVIAAAAGGRPMSQDDTDLLPRADLQLEPPSLPSAARGRAVYAVYPAMNGTQAAETRTEKPGLPTSEPATEAWRKQYVVGSSARAIPVPAVLALDRRLPAPTVAMEPALAEPLVKAQPYSQGQSLVSVRLVFDAEKVDVGSGGQQPVLLAKVQRLELVDKEHRVLATIPAAQLAAPTRATAAPPPPDPSRAQAPGPTGPTAQDLEKQEQDKSDQIGARLRKPLEQRWACEQEALKKGSPISKEFQDAVDACMARK